MLSQDFELMKPWCALQSYQDMTRPLTDYFISTSHNTYLFNSQVMGDSNPEAYNRVLRAGCRAVELDCYDGENGQPIVKHAHTLVKPCLFESIIRSIKPNLFSKSPYPVVLDLENHCSLEQQQEMARILEEILGDHLINKPLSEEYSIVLPSPEELKYKVLVRIIQKRLSELFVYLQNVPFREYKYAKANYVCYHSPNVVENHFGRVVRDEPASIVKQTAKTLCRLYPRGIRQDSSNLDPIVPWNFGVQMVALNFQKDDKIMALCYGKFSDNGGCGYVLKPNYLIDTSLKTFNPIDYQTRPSNLSEDGFEQSQTLIITIISAQFLSRTNSKSNDVPDPYVEVSTHGMPCDQQAQQTSVVKNNGLNPIWKETFQFQISFPEMCLVLFTVYDHDVLSKDDRLVYFCLPMKTMQRGFRHMRLRSKNNGLTDSTLFVHVQIEGYKEDDYVTRL
ncbi:unnamed protein product [Rotaria sp. Silwood2]|nr:unnamed protein product [Rotaria sp. Silwood2]CAF4219912.1 unnamed protein product [Rotaria sp. Silwood2]